MGRTSNRSKPTLNDVSASYLDETRQCVPEIKHTPCSRTSPATWKKGGYVTAIRQTTPWPLLPSLAQGPPFICPKGKPAKTGCAHIPSTPSPGFPPAHTGAGTLEPGAKRRERACRADSSSKLRGSSLPVSLSILMAQGESKLPAKRTADKRCQRLEPSNQLLHVRVSCFDTDPSDIVLCYDTLSADSLSFGLLWTDHSRAQLQQMHHSR